MTGPAITRYGLVEVVNTGGRAKTRHLAEARYVPPSEIVWAAAAGHDREQYLERARPEHAGAPVCGRCWSTLPGVVEVRLVGAVPDVHAALGRLRAAVPVEVSRPRESRHDPGTTIVYGYLVPPGALGEGRS